MVFKVSDRGLLLKATPEVELILEQFQPWIGAPAAQQNDIVRLQIRHREISGEHDIRGNLIRTVEHADLPGHIRIGNVGKELSHEGLCHRPLFPAGRRLVGQLGDLPLLVFVEIDFDDATDPAASSGLSPKAPGRFAGHSRISVAISVHGWPQLGACAQRRTGVRAREG